METKISYNWKLSEAEFSKNKGKVFSCFACGGGSTMGYKLAGFDVIGCNEIDKKIMACYLKNHNPKYYFLEDIKIFKDRDDLPEELYNLDILDGSPPCSSFSMVGNRKDDWGKEKRFREGQCKQVLDTLFFDFIDLAKKLQPKIIIAENVKGILLGEAIKYSQKIIKSFENSGYEVEHFIINASDTGVPQRRERVFFIAIRKDLVDKIDIDKINLLSKFPNLKLNFNEKQILFKDIKTDKAENLITGTKELELWNNRQESDNSLADSNFRLYGKITSWFSHSFIKDNAVCQTIVANDNNILYSHPRSLNKEEICLIGSFPLDYDFLNNNPKYIIGMSVPPIMMYKIAIELYNQILIKLNK